MAYSETPFTPDPSRQQPANLAISVEKKIATGFFLALVFLAAIGAASYRSLSRHLADTGSVQHTDEVLAKIDVLLAAIADAEAAETNYTATGEEHFLVPFEIARRATLPHVEELRTLTADNPSQQRRLATLVPLIEERLTLARAAIEARQRESTASPSGRGEELHRLMRGFMQELAGEEHRLRTERLARASASLVRTRVFIVAASALAFVFLALAALLVRKELAGRRRAEAGLRAAQADLERRVAERTAELFAAGDGLRASERRYRELFENNPMPMWIYDYKSMEIVAVNDAALAYFGYPRAQFLGMTILELRPPEVRERLLREVRSITGPLRRAGVWPQLRGDGSVVLADITTHDLLFEERAARLVLANDVTERERAQDEVRRLNAELETRVRERTAQLEATNAELESFSYSVSHDLRAPLRAIAGFTQAIEEDAGAQLGEASRGYLQRVRAATERMASLIDDLLNLARVTRAELVRQPMDLSALAQAIVADLRMAAPERDVRVEIEDGLLADGDRRLIRVLLENLLGNAWKFTGKKAHAKIAFRRLQEHAASEVFAISDDGSGFDMRYAGKMFGAFQRLHAVREFPGTGIGLATVQRIVHRHGGRVWAEGAVNQGATFFFTLSDEPASPKPT